MYQSLHNWIKSLFVSYIKTFHIRLFELKIDLFISVKKRQINTVSGTGIAFFAGLTSTFQHTNSNQDIVFDRVFTNLGNSYHVSHGIFGAPTPGIYIFSVTIVADGQAAHAKLVKNG